MTSLAALNPLPIPTSNSSFLKAQKNTTDRLNPSLDASHVSFISNASKVPIYKSKFRSPIAYAVRNVENSSSPSPSPPRETLIIERESVIQTIKPRIISVILDSFESDEDRNDFSLVCSEIESRIQSWYAKEFEEMMEIYSLFEPTIGNSKLKEQKMSVGEIEELEDKFLDSFFVIMRKSNYELLNEKEFELAKNGRYLLDFPITVNKKKLDSKLFLRYFNKNKIQSIPEFSDQFVIFRRGIGIERIKNYFFIEKIDIILSKIGSAFLSKLGIHQNGDLKSENGEIVIKRNSINHSNNEGLSIERIRIENMDLNLKTFFQQITVQEPTFSRITVLFRKKQTDKHKVEENGEGREICIMHFQQVPMADMEIVLPEKKKPSLSPFDLLKFSITAIGGLTFLNFSDLEFNSIFFFAASSYFLKLYLKWNTSLNRYENLINQSMYNKHLDNGKGTLLHLQYEAIQQEIKEAVISYYILEKQGPCSIEELDRKCEKFLFDNFEETVNFEVLDALEKLFKLNLVSKNDNEIYSSTSFKILAKRAQDNASISKTVFSV